MIQPMLKTAIGEMTPETVRQAFIKTGLHPNPHVYIDTERNQACAIGAFIYANAPDRIDEKAYNSGNYRQFRFALGTTQDETDAITSGFFLHMPRFLDRNLRECYELGRACRKAVRDLMGGETNEPTDA